MYKCCICLVLSDYKFATFGLLFQNGVDSMARSMEKPRALEDANDKMKPWQLAEIVDPAHCRMVTMPDSADATNKVILFDQYFFSCVFLFSNT